MKNLKSRIESGEVVEHIRVKNGIETAVYIYKSGRFFCVSYSDYDLKVKTIEEGNLLEFLNLDFAIAKFSSLTKTANYEMRLNKEGDKIVISRVSGMRFGDTRVVAWYIDIDGNIERAHRQSTKFPKCQTHLIGEAIALLKAQL